MHVGKGKALHCNQGLLLTACEGMVLTSMVHPRASQIVEAQRTGPDVRAQCEVGQLLAGCSNAIVQGLLILLLADSILTGTPFSAAVTTISAPRASRVMRRSTE